MTASRDWSAWMRNLGRQVRRIRKFLGLSQEQIARAAGVSQGAISRLEAARGLAMPLLVAVKVQTALVAALRAMDPAILSDELRAMVEAENVVSFPVHGALPAPLTRDRGLDEVIHLYRALPERQRAQAVAVFRAAAQALAPHVAEEKPGE